MRNEKPGKKNWRWPSGHNVGPHDPTIAAGAGGSGDRVNQIDPNDNLRRGHVADCQDGLGPGARDAKQTRAGGLGELDPAGRRLRVALAAVLIRS